MDDLGKMLGGVTGGTSGSGDIAGAIGGLVGGEGGLGGLVGKLQQGGLGDAVSSWVGTGPNKQVDPGALGAALGPEKVQAVADQAGIDVGALLPMLAGVLPTVVDALTPDGQVPSGNAAAGLDIGGLLQGLGGAANAGPESPLGQLGKMMGGR